MVNLTPEMFHLEETIRGAAQCHSTLAATALLLSVAAFMLTGAIVAGILVARTFVRPPNAHPFDWSPNGIARLVNIASKLLTMNYLLRRRFAPPAAPVTPPKSYATVLKQLEDDQGEWHVRMVLERELSKILKFYGEQKDSDVPKAKNKARDDEESGSDEESEDELTEDEKGEEKQPEPTKPDNEEGNTEDEGDSDEGDSDEGDSDEGDSEGDAEGDAQEEIENVDLGGAGVVFTSSIPAPAARLPPPVPESTAPAHGTTPAHDAVPAHAVAARDATSAQTTVSMDTVVAKPKRAWNQMVSSVIAEDSVWQQHADDLARTGDKMEFVSAMPREIPSDAAISKNAVVDH